GRLGHRDQRVEGLRGVGEAGEFRNDALGQAQAVLDAHGVVFPFSAAIGSRATLVETDSGDGAKESVGTRDFSPRERRGWSGACFGPAAGVTRWSTWRSSWVPVTPPTQNRPRPLRQSGHGRLGKNRRLPAPKQSSYRWIV